jgi:hypothetical protein
MRIIETKAYKFDELSEEAKGNAIENFRSHQQQNGDYLFFFAENCSEQAKEKGFEEIDLTYSLSYCQGDGLSFSAKEYTKLEELFIEVLGKGKEKTAKILAENCDVKIEKNRGHYCYASKNDVDIYLESYTSSMNCRNFDNCEDVVNQVRTNLENIYLELCKQLENEGYADIEYQDSDEAITESIEANEYEFTEDGIQI